VSPRPSSSGSSQDAALGALRNDVLLQALVRDPQALAEFCNVVKDQRSRVQEEAAAALVVAFRLFGAGLVVELFRFMCERVVEECGSSEQVLAVDSLCKKTMAYCLRELLGKQFLQEAFGGTLSEICTYDVVLNASKADAVKEIAIVDHLFSTAQTCFDCLKRARPRLPRDAVEALMLLRGKLEGKFDHLGHLLCERYLFGLFTNVIVQPYPLVVARAPGSGAQRSLVALAKVVQTTYSGMTSNPTINDSDNYASMLARFVSENYVLVESYIGLPQACPISSAPAAPLLAAEVQAARVALVNAKSGESTPATASPRMVPAQPDVEVKKGRSLTSRSPRKEPEKDKDKEKSPSLLRSRTGTLFGGGKEKEKASPILSPRKEEPPAAVADGGRSRGKTLGSAFKKLVSNNKSSDDLNTSKSKAGGAPEVQPRTGWSKSVAPSAEIAAALVAAKLEQEKLQKDGQAKVQSPSVSVAPVDAKNHESVPALSREVAMAEFEDTDTANMEDFHLHNPLELLHQEDSSEINIEADEELARAKLVRKEAKQQRLLKEAVEAKKLYQLRLSAQDAERKSQQELEERKSQQEMVERKSVEQVFVVMNDDGGNDDTQDLSEIGNMLSELSHLSALDSLTFNTDSLSVEEKKVVAKQPPMLPPKKPVAVHVPIGDFDDPDEIVIASSPVASPIAERNVPGEYDDAPVEVLGLDELEEVVTSPRAENEDQPTAADGTSTSSVATRLNRPKKPSGAKGRRAPTLRSKESGPEVKSEEELMVEQRAVVAKKPPVGGVGFILPGLGVSKVVNDDDDEESAVAAKPSLGGQKVLTVGSAASFGSGVMPKFDPSKVTLRKGNSSQVQGAAAREAQLLMEEKRRREDEAKQARDDADALLQEMADEEWALAEEASRVGDAEKEAKLRQQEHALARKRKEESEEQERLVRVAAQEKQLEEAERDQTEQKKAELKRKARESAARFKAQERKAEEEAHARAEAERENVKRLEREEAERREREEAERIEQAELKRKAKEEMVLQAKEEQEAKRKAKEEESRKALEEAERLEQEETAKRKLKEEEAKRKDAEKKQQEEAKKLVELERKMEAEAKAAKMQKEVELAKKAEEKARLLREKETAKKQEEAKRVAEEKARKVAHAKQQEEEEKRQRYENEARSRAEEEEAAKKQQRQLEDTRKKEEEERAQAAEAQKKVASEESEDLEALSKKSGEVGGEEEAPKSPGKSPTLRVRAKSDAAQKFVQRVTKKTGKTIDLEVVPEAVVVEDEPKEKPCGQCGSIVAVGDTFCSECGATVEAPKSPAAKRELAGTKKDMRALIAAKAQAKKK
jgi:hypothetical protein